MHTEKREPLAEGMESRAMHRFLDGSDAREALGAAYSQSCSTAVLPGLLCWAPAAGLPAAVSPPAQVLCACCSIAAAKCRLVGGWLLRLGM